jgi:hypothetical protein
MPKKRDLIAEELSTLADDLESLWRAATHDPKKEARRRRTWMIITSILSAGSTLVARRAAAKLWPILTGETPPIPVAPPQSSAQAQNPTPDAAADRPEQPTAA